MDKRRLAAAACIAVLASSAARAGPRDADLVRAVGDRAESARLLAAGANINGNDDFDETPLSEAIKDLGFGGDELAKVQTVKWLLDKGAGPNVATPKGALPLIIAAGTGHNDGQSDEQVAVVRLLLERGAAVNAQETGDGWTALHMAAFRGYADTIKLLLAHGARTDLHGARGERPADVAANRAVRALLH